MRLGLRIEPMFTVWRVTFISRFGDLRRTCSEIGNVTSTQLGSSGCVRPCNSGKHCVLPSFLPSFRFRISGKPRCEVALLSDCLRCGDARAHASLNTNAAVQEDNANVRLPPSLPPPPPPGFLPPRDCFDDGDYDGDTSTARLNSIWDSIDLYTLSLQLNY